MIIVQLSGGFGNQLFQYAAGLSLAAHHNVEAKVDVSLLVKPDIVTGTARQPDIFNLKKPPVVASENEILSCIDIGRTAKFVDKIRPFHKRRIYKEKSNLFDNKFFNASNNLLLRGNRQSEKYFKRFENIIRETFALSDYAIASVKTFGETLSQQNSISIHIRRGDYLTPVALEWLGVLPISYYYDAIASITQRVKDCKFYIFSDDIEWAKENLKIEYQHQFMSASVSENSMEDFYLMTKCKHNIIANSTFSWWAAWLNSNRDKIITAPSKWYNQVKFDTRDLIPPEWIKL